MDFNEARLDEATFIRISEFFLPVNSVSWWQSAFEWDIVYCSRRIFIVRKLTERLERTWFRLFIGEKPDFYGSPGSLLSCIQEVSSNKFWMKCAAPVVPSFSLQWKSDESTQHYLTQMSLTINWRYWQAGKNSRMRIEVQGRLMQERFIEIRQVFAKK